MRGISSQYPAWYIVSKSCVSMLEPLCHPRQKPNIDPVYAGAALPLKKSALLTSCTYMFHICWFYFVMHACGAFACFKDWAKPCARDGVCT